MVKKNDEYIVTIEDMGSEGEGVGKIDGYTVFVKDALPGEEARIKITKAGKNFGYGRLMEVITPSEYRVEPKCPIARKCGGCQIQEMSYEAQLAFKEKKVQNNLERIGKISPSEYEMCTIIGMDEPYNYRNKAQYPVGLDKEGNIVMGFYAGRTHSIIPCEDCAIGDKINSEILAIVKSHMEEYKIQPYNEETHKGVVRHVLIRRGFTTNQCMVCIIINGSELKGSTKLVERFKNIEGMTSISININKEKTNVIMGKTVIDLYGEGYIEDYIGDVKFRISPLSFYQVNPVQTKELYGKALEFAGLTGEETVWDMYCGVGTISLFLAKAARKVYGVEIVPEAIEDARKNAKINNIENAEFFVGKAEEVVPKMYREYGLGADVVVVDPPRKGCDEKLLETMISMSPEKIVYVSCDSATLARDLEYLKAHGYGVKKVQPVDMFPHSVHVETVILLSRKTPDAIIEIDLEMSELDLTRAESKATYKEIEEYVQNKYGLHVTNLYIAQVKREFGIIERINYNVGDGKSRVPQVTPEKREAIIDALKYFQMIEV
ncbi:MAG: 23S rRNA (uracil(1939)-C(5))-methyltransferase RlmD [Lachnospiraceae bacterium]|nr:23S rRNA (uracil(1939)-C(5))-methyltransferase RlmD [Lachnospiraceae bacterium]